MFLIGITGFCIKPLRDSGAITLPELFEKRFGKFIRWLAGVVIVCGGLLNMGVFLKIGGDFLCLVCGLDIKYLALMMTALLVMVCVYTILGGMLSVLVTDFLQFVVMSIGLLVVTVMILHQVGWEKIFATVEQHHGAGGFNPITNPNLGWTYCIMQVLGNTAAALTWQTVIARVLAAKDSQTGRKVYTGTAAFFVCRWLIPGLWGIRRAGDFGLAAIETTHRRRTRESPARDSGKNLRVQTGPAARRNFPNPRQRPSRPPSRTSSTTPRCMRCRSFSARSSRWLDGTAHRGDAGGRHVHGFELHAQLGQRHLQRHPRAVPPRTAIRPAGHSLEPLHRRANRRVSAGVRIALHD
jgi:hypothetical protein